MEPGFGGQKFQPAVMSKVRALRSRFNDLNIEVPTAPCRPFFLLCTHKQSTAGYGLLPHQCLTFNALRATSVLTSVY